VERAAFVAASTAVIGVAPVVPLTYAEPFHVSSQLASLDHVSGGRAGWVVSEERRPEAARAWGRPLVDGAAARARGARDGIAVVRALWDSWEDDAVIRSVACSRYLDRDRLHYVDFTPGGDPHHPGRGVPDRRPRPVGRLEGRCRLRLAGRLHLGGARCGTPSTPPGAAVRRRPGADPAAQRSGYPVIFQVGDSAEGRDLAARNADVIFSAHGEDFDDALAFAEDVRARLTAAGRPEDDLRILPGTEIIIGATEEEAQEKKRWIRRQQVTPATALGIAGLLWNRDLSDRDADGPLPKEDPVVVENDGSFGARRVADPHKVVAEWREKAQADGWSLRETVIVLGPQRGHVGTPAGLADRFAPGCGTAPSTGSTSRRT
jgi:alkanesulfonate monooxygenase SsuD/methylene tetrahydromethanopterin reductase-like flavin-dependent oxidoreductase (luciferase family)